MNTDQHDSNSTAPSAPLKTRTSISRQRFLQFVGLGLGAAALASRFLPRPQQATIPVTSDTLSHQERVLVSVTTDCASSPPFSFTYGGIAFPRNWTMASDYHQHLDAYRTRRTITWTHADGKGQVIFELVAYHEFNLAEWIVTFNNRGASGPTSEFANVLAINWRIDLGSPVIGITTGNGSQANPWDFGPAYPELSAADPTRLFYCNGGRSTDGVSAPSGNTYLANGGWPYFNLRNASVSQPGTQGIITALGWPGQWVYQMSRTGRGTAVTLAAGMAHVDSFTGLPDITSASDPAHLLRVTLRNSGEHVRTPRMVVMFWDDPKGWTSAQNQWRRWMLAHNTPQVRLTAGSDIHNRQGGPDSWGPSRPPNPLGGVQGWIDASGGQIDTVTDELAWMTGASPAGFVTAGLAQPSDNGTTLNGDTHDHWILDAGWYASADATNHWSNVGSWQPSPTRYQTVNGVTYGSAPGWGIKYLSDQLHANHLKFALWFEPERVSPNTAIANNHSSWLLGSPGGDRLFDFSQDAARNWAVNYYGDPSSGLIAAYGVDVWRHDFNIQPLGFWTAQDNVTRGSGKYGWTQAKYCENLLYFWDHITHNNPGLLIDISASGGRRCDVETMRRGIPMQRDDHPSSDVVSMQAMTYQLSYWLPYSGTGVAPEAGGSTYAPSYTLRSVMTPCYFTATNIKSVNAPTNIGILKAMSTEWWQIADCYFGDFYQLAGTHYDQADQTIYCGWQFARPEQGDGMVQIFRRNSETAIGATRHWPLQGLINSLSVVYAVTDFDSGTATTYTGAYLTSTGLPATLAQGTAKTFKYTKVGDSSLTFGVCM